MIWQVNYTDHALQDLQSIFDYISLILFEPRIAVKQTERIMDAADSLEHMPFRHHLYDKEPWHSKGLRVLTVDNYLVFYLPDEMKKHITIIRIMYGKRDINKHLSILAK